VVVGSVGVRQRGPLVVEVDRGGIGWRYSVVSVHEGEVLCSCEGLFSREGAAALGMRAAYLMRDQLECDVC
jgi:hypothetical protein